MHHVFLLLIKIELFVIFSTSVFSSHKNVTRSLFSNHLRNEFNFWNVHRIMITSGLLQSLGFTLTLQETRSIHDSMNIPKIELIAYIYILL